MTLDLKTSWYRVSFQVICMGSSALLNQQNDFCDFLRILELYYETKKKKIANNDFGLENELVSGFISSSLRGLLSFA